MIAIFYHIGQVGIGAFIYQQQIHRLYCSGLINKADYIHLGVSGNNDLFDIPDKAIIKRNNNLKEETDTLISLKEFCKENPNYKVLYLHTKGSSKQSLEVNAWRLYMEYFLIDRWKECVKYLDKYDCCGVDFNKNGNTVWSDGSLTPPKYDTGHFSGNFWWANASYINTLDESYLYSGFRLDREFWIGTNLNVKSKCINYSGIEDFYNLIYENRNYIK